MEVVRIGGANFRIGHVKRRTFAQNNVRTDKRITVPDVSFGERNIHAVKLNRPEEKFVGITIRIGIVKGKGRPRTTGDIDDEDRVFIPGNNVVEHVSARRCRQVKYGTAAARHFNVARSERINVGGNNRTARGRRRTTRITVGMSQGNGTRLNSKTTFSGNNAVDGTAAVHGKNVDVKHKVAGFGDVNATDLIGSQVFVRGGVRFHNKKRSVSERMRRRGQLRTLVNRRGAGVVVVDVVKRDFSTRNSKVAASGELRTQRSIDTANSFNRQRLQKIDALQTVSKIQTVCVALQDVTVSAFGDNFATVRNADNVRVAFSGFISVDIKSE